MTRIPKMYTAQDYLDVAAGFKFNKSVNPIEIAGREAQAGRGVNIMEDQVAGERIGLRMARQLEGPDAGLWASVLGGATLNSALYLYRELSGQPMSRRVDLADVLDEDGNLRDSDDRRAEAFSATQGAINKGDAALAAKRERELTNREKVELAKSLAHSSMWLSAFDLELYENDEPAVTMARVRDAATEMHHNLMRLTFTLRFNPTLAQLRSESTPLGSYIMQAPEDEMPLSAKQAFRESLSVHSDVLGY